MPHAPVGAKKGIKILFEMLMLVESKTTKKQNPASIINAH
jgi:hypothetical protein